MLEGKNHEDAASEAYITLDEAHLQMGDLVQLQSLSADNDVRYSVRMIGLAKGRSVLVSTPMEDGKYLLMREGQSFIFRTFSGKSAYAFQAQIIKSVNTPFPYLHLTYPKQVRSLVIRKGARAAVKLVCAITRCDDVVTQLAGTLVNLSVGGALMTCKQVPGKKGQRITLKFRTKVNEIEALIELDAIIRSIHEDSGTESATDMPFQVGLQFVELTTEKSIPLLAYVYFVLLEQSSSN